MKEKTKLQTILEEKGMSQVDVIKRSEELCITPLNKDMVSRISSGLRQDYSTHTLLKLCVSLGVSPDDILEYEKFINTKLTDKGIDSLK